MAARRKKLTERLTLKLPPQDLRRLRTAADECGVSVAAFIRVALWLRLQEVKKAREVLRGR